MSATNTIGQPVQWQMDFQTASSPVMEGIVQVHNLLLWVIAGVSLLVLAALLYIVYRFRASKNPIPSNCTHNTTLEVIWTLVPVILLIIIGIPSIRLLHKMDKPVNADMTVKVMGHQWYWSYEYPDPADSEKKIGFDSYMIEDKDLKPGQLRLFEVDNPMVVPVDTIIKVLVTAADVLHSFAVPALGIKKDAVPGRINETWFQITKPGTYYGQCSELCGAKHGFMPIAVKAVSKAEYATWLQEKSAPKAPSKAEVHKMKAEQNKKELHVGA
jgi:cytochrome c oxidase subunit 2